TREHPLVVFADDLQWADRGSLDLLRILASAADLPYLLLIVAFRPAAIASSDAVRTTIEALCAGCALARSIDLGSLDLAAVSALCRAALRSDRESAGALAAVLLPKTAGNPFFLKRLLRFLHQTRTLAFEAEDSRWHWDLARVEAVSVTEDVADLLVASL